jgi:hypothetical protein
VPELLNFALVASEGRVAALASALDGGGGLGSDVLLPHQKAPITNWVLHATAQQRAELKWLLEKNITENNK